MKNAKIVLIGAGNLAFHLANRLSNNGITISQVYSRTEESAKTLAELIGADWTTNLSELQADASLYIVSLKDSAFIDLLPQITAGKPNALFVHTAGSIPVDIWKGHAHHYGVVYPLQTFSKQREVDFSGIPVFIEAGSPEDLEKIRELSSFISGKIYEVNSDQRRALHLSAVFACNFTNYLYSIAYDLLKEKDIPFDVLLPLIDETAGKIHHLTPRDAQTGPAVRYDMNVIGKHLELLSGHPDLKRIYELLSQGIFKNSAEKENKDSADKK